MNTVAATGDGDDQREQQADQHAALTFAGGVAGELDALEVVEQLGERGPALHLVDHTQCTEPVAGRRDHRHARIKANVRSADDQRIVGESIVGSRGHSAMTKLLKFSQNTASKGPSVCSGFGAAVWIVPIRRGGSIGSNCCQLPAVPWTVSRAWCVSPPLG